MTISNCCGADIDFHYSSEGTNYMECRKCLKPCDTKPMKHTVKIGDRFRLGAWEYRVHDAKDLRFFCATRVDDDGCGIRLDLLTDADKLDWIKPEPTCSKEFAEALQVELKRKWIDCDQIDRWLDAHTEKE